MEENLTIHTGFQMYKCYKTVIHPGIKNSIEIEKLFKKKGNFEKKPEATDVGIVRLKAQSEKQLPQRKAKTQAVTWLRDKRRRAGGCKIWSVTLVKGVVRGAEARFLQQQG